MRTSLLTYITSLLIGSNCIGQQTEMKILTLSKGKYVEIENNDSLQRIGSVVVNMYTGDLYELLDSDILYNESELHPTVITRFWSIDPLATKYPGQSPYAFCNNNPIVFKDPDGRSGIITITPGKDGNPGTITFSFNAILYGGGATPELAKASQEYLTKMVNSQNLKYVLNGQEYTVQLDLHVDVHSEASAFGDASGFVDDGTHKSQGAPNTDYSKNFIRVEDINTTQKQAGDANPWVALRYAGKHGYVSEWGGLGANSGFMISGTYSTDYTELLHELWHGMFGQHELIPKDITKVILMFALNAKADEYTKIPQDCLTTREDGVKLVDFRKRMLSVEDINMVFNALGYATNSSGTGVDGVPIASGTPTTINVGNLDNNYYGKDGKINNNKNVKRSNE